MARNKEKHVIGLNRVWLQTLDEENEKKNPPRPSLGSLKTAAEIRNWIPSIKKDIDFCLKQSQVACYPGSVVDGYTSQVDSLVKEYKAYIRKLRELDADPNPWTDRPYKRKNIKPESTIDDVSEEDKSEEGSDTKVQKTVSAGLATLSTPILDNDESYTDLYGYNEPNQTVVPVETQTQDLPLTFRPNDSNQLALTYFSGAEGLSDEPLDFGHHGEDRSSTEAHSKSNDCSESKVNLEDVHSVSASTSNFKSQSNSTDDIRTTYIGTSDSCDRVLSQSGPRDNSSFTDNQEYSIKGKTSATSANIKLYIPYSDSSSSEENDDPT